MYFFLLLLVTIFFSKTCFGKSKPVHYQPEQIHLSFGGPNQMIVTWNTYSPVKESIVEYGIDQMNFQASGSSRILVNSKKSLPFIAIQYVHKVVLSGLKPGTKYIYHCGSHWGWSSIFTFTTMPDDINWVTRIALFGDMGNINAQSLSRLQKETVKGMYDAIFHVGDFAYDMQDNGGQTGDEFMRQIQPIAAYLPYMTCPGNHEAFGNFTNYKLRFNMPGDVNSMKMFYSFNIGRAHVISFSTEYYFFIEYGFWQIKNQYDWLIKDLEKANKPANRARYPWIITMAHRPMYCSNNDKDDCTKSESLIRIGIPWFHKFGLEDLFYKYGVDLCFWAHEHSYERLFPLYNRKMYNGSQEKPYTNPKAPVHITTGSAGCQERHDAFRNKTAAWSAFRSLDYGYTKMTIYNESHIYIRQLSDDQGGKIIDKIWLIKEYHGSYEDNTLKFQRFNNDKERLKSPFFKFQNSQMEF